MIHKLVSPIILIGLSFIIANCEQSSTSSSRAPSQTVHVYSGQLGAGSIGVATASSTGDLTSHSSMAITPSVVAMVTHPTLNVVYAAAGNGDVFQLSASSTGLSTLATKISDSTLTNPVYIAVSPNGKFLYVVDSAAASNGAIRLYTINSTTGALTQAGVYSGTDGGNTPDAPFGIVVTPDNKFAYVVYFGSSSICAFAVNSTSGALTQVGSTCIASTNTNFSIVTSQDNNALYVSGAGAGIERYSINTSTGALTQLGVTTLSGTSGSVTSRSMVRVGSYLYAAVNDGTISTYAIASDGSLGSPSITTLSGFTVSPGNGIDALGFPVAGGYLFAVDQGENKIFPFVILTSGALTQGTGSFTTGQISPSSVAAIIF